MSKRCGEMCCGESMWLDTCFRGYEWLKCEVCGFYGER